MKPVKKDGKRQQRRERTLARLEQYLEGGVKYQQTAVVKVGKRFVSNGNVVPFEQKDIDRISKEIAVLKERLGRGPVQVAKEYEHQGA